MQAHSGRPKVIHVIVAGQVGGAERFLVDLASRPELSGADHCIALMTPNPKLRAFLSGAGLNVRDRGPVREDPLTYLWRSFGPADTLWLRRVLLEEGANIIHAHTFGSHILAARAGLQNKLPVVRTEHGVRHYRDPSCALYRHWALRHTDRIAAISAFVARTVAAVAPHAMEKIQIIPNGVDMTYFHRTPPASNDAFTFSIVSRLEPIKRVALAIEAAARTSDIRLNIVGEGSERKKLEKLASGLGVENRINFLGYLHDPRPAVAASDAIINCTREEGLGLSVIEAAAMQKPAVAFDCGGIPEIVQDGRTGWLVRAQSVDALAAAMKAASTSRSQAAEFGINARNWVEGKFAIDTMCKNYAAIYREFAEGPMIAPTLAAP
ncbi:MAG: glycosyltransferase family 4 protein [Alphaproteobacteria bacterium]|nr:glycosyltransferase family 4 protein [Alphaproteobacteria bacterium]